MCLCDICWNVGDVGKGSLSNMGYMPERACYRANQAVGVKGHHRQAALWGMGPGKTPIWNLAPPRDRCPRSAGVSKFGGYLFLGGLWGMGLEKPIWNLAAPRGRPLARRKGHQIGGYPFLSGLPASRCTGSRSLF
jgi:hypothetical protein